MEDGFPLLVNRVVDNLSAEECRTLLFLCSDLLSAQHVDDCTGALLALTAQTHTHMGQSRPREGILKEILFRLNRFDILNRILGSSKMEVKNLLQTSGSVVSDYRVLMMELSDRLGKEDLHSLVFLLGGTIPNGPLEQATSFLDVVIELEKIDKVSCDNLELVEQCLRNIRRVDLVTRIKSYQTGQHRSHREVSHSATCNSAQFGAQTPMRKQEQLAEGLENLKLSVAESRTPCTQGLVDEYYINSEFRGVCLIIDCIGCDGELLKQTFEQLGFQVDLHSLLAVEEVYSVLRSVSRQGALQQVSMFFCCLLSRGTDTHLLATNTEGPGFPLTELKQLFSPMCCPLLVGKPKLFFVQSYTVAPPTPGMDECYLETDGVPSCAASTHPSTREMLSAAADVLWSMCRTEAWLLERQGHQSVYFQALSSALIKARLRRLDILNALLEVNRDVFEHNQRCPEQTYHLILSHTLRKVLHL